MRVHRSWLYVPGDRPDRVAKAIASGADAVVVDLEDAVPPNRKDIARRHLLDLLSSSDAADDRARIWVRVNDPAGPWGEADLASLTGLAGDLTAGPPLAGLRIPGASDPDLVRRVATQVLLPLQLLIETAAGLACAMDLATAHPLVVGIGLGEADLAADLRVGHDSGLDWARGHIVMTARAAGLPSPVQSVWTDVADQDGLFASSIRGRGLGFLGRSVVHPRQITPVHRAYTPSRDEVAVARATLDTADAALARGEVALLDAAGRFVDPAVVNRARLIIDIAESYSTDSTDTTDAQEKP